MTGNWERLELGLQKVGESVIMQGLMPVMACERCRLRKLGKVLVLLGQDMGERK